MDAEEFRWLIVAAQREGNRHHDEMLRPLGLTTSQAEVLLTLRRYQPLSLSELGDLLVCETHSPSRLVDGLVRRGLVDRTPAPADRRKVVLSLTDKGAAAARQAAEVERRLHRWIGGLLRGASLGDAPNVLRRAVEGRPAGLALARRAELDRRRR